MSATTWLMIPILCAPTLLAVPALAGNTQQVKPACNAKTRGSLWPEKTSRGAAVPIEICAPKRWAFSWQQLTVDVSQLRAAAAQGPAIGSNAEEPHNVAETKAATGANPTGVTTD